MIFTKKTQRSTKDTKLDLDDASLCVLCVLFFFLCDKKMSLSQWFKKFGMILHVGLFSTTNAR